MYRTPGAPFSLQQLLTHVKNHVPHDRVNDFILYETIQRFLTLHPLRAAEAALLHAMCLLTLRREWVHALFGKNFNYIITHDDIKDLAQSLNIKKSFNKLALFLAVGLNFETTATSLMQRMTVQGKFEIEQQYAWRHPKLCPLALAVCLGHERMIQRLLDADPAYIQRIGNHTLTKLLLLAADFEHRRVFRTLLVATRGYQLLCGFSATAYDGTPESFSPAPLCKLILAKESDTVVFIYTHGIDVDEPIANDGSTAIAYAIATHNLWLTDALIRLHADVDAYFTVKAPWSHYAAHKLLSVTPIMMAACYGNEDIVRLLVEKAHADIELRDSGGQSALDFAFACAKEHIAVYLMQRGATLTRPTFTAVALPHLMLYLAEARHPSHKITHWDSTVVLPIAAKAPLKSSWEIALSSPKPDVALQLLQRGMPFDKGATLMAICIEWKNTSDWFSLLRLEQLMHMLAYVLWMTPHHTVDNIIYRQEYPISYYFAAHLAYLEQWVKLIQHGITHFPIDTHEHGAKKIVRIAHPRVYTFSNSPAHAPKPLFLESKPPALQQRALSFFLMHCIQLAKNDGRAVSPLQSTVIFYFHLHFLLVNNQPIYPQIERELIEAFNPPLPSSSPRQNP